MKTKRRDNVKVTESDIRELEERWHVTLPQDYKAFLFGDERRHRKPFR